MDLESLGEQSPLKILLIQFKYLGDLAVVTPLFQAIRDKYPLAQIDMLVGEHALPIVRDNPLLAKTWGYPRRHKFSELVSLVRALRREHYDISVDLWGNDRGAVLGRLIGADFRVGAQPRRGFRFRKFLYTHWVEDFDVERHEVIRDWAILAPLGVPEPASLAMHMVAPAAYETAARELLGDIKVLCNIGASQPRREWPVDRWIEFYDRAANLGPRIAFTSGHTPAEKQRLEELRRRRPDVAILESPEPLELYLAVLAQLKAFVTCDSGPMHFAAALGTPTIAMFGPTRALRWAPIGDKHRYIQGDLCYCSGHLSSCVAQKHCMNGIGVDRLVAEYQESIVG